MSAEAIAATNAELMAAFARRDAAAAAAFYTEDGKLMAPFLEPFVGRAAIERFIEEGFAGGVAGLELETLNLEVFGDTAWEEGLYTVSGAAGERLDHGKYIVIWKSIDGAWLMARDIMSSNLPRG